MASQNAPETTSTTRNASTVETASAEEASQRTRRRFLAVWTWVGAILLVGVGVFLAGILAIPIGIIIWTVVIVFILGGVVDFLDKRGMPRIAATALSYVLLAVVLALLIFLIVSPDVGLGAQLGALAASLPTYADAITAWATDMYYQYSDLLQSDMVQQWLSSASASLGEMAQNVASASATGVLAAGASIGNIFLTIGFALVVAFWMLMDLPKLHREAARLVGEKHREGAEMLYVTFTRVMGGYIKATLLQCTVIGILCGVLFAILGITSPAALGLITGLMNIIPIVGPWIGGALAFIASVWTDPIVAVIALIGTIVIQQAIYTFVSPKLMSNSVDIHPALTFIALMGGSGIGTALGGLGGALVGALLSIPAVAVAKSVFVYYFEKNTGRRIVAEDGVFFKGVTMGAGEEVDPMADATASAPEAQPLFPVTGTDSVDMMTDGETVTAPDNAEPETADPPPLLKESVEKPPDEAADGENR